MVFLHCWGDGKFQLYHVATATYQRLVQGNEDRPMIYHLPWAFSFSGKEQPNLILARKSSLEQEESRNYLDLPTLGGCCYGNYVFRPEAERASVTTPTDAGRMNNQQFSVTCETVAVKVEVRSITKVVFFCCFF